MNAPALHIRGSDPFYACLARAGISPYLRPRFDADAEDNLEAHVSASAPSTLCGFSTDILRWINACQVSGADPLKPQPRDVRNFIRIFEIGRKPSTVKRMLANIGVLVSAICGHTNVCSSKVVRSELKRIQREHGSRHKQAMPIRLLGDVASMDDPAKPFSIERMLHVLEPDNSLRALRGKLILSLGGDTGRRNSEYRDANFSHLMRQPDGTGTFHVDRSKTDQAGNGIVRFASRRTIRYMEAWRAARIAAGEIVTADSPLFIGLDQHGNPGKRLCPAGYHIALRWTVQKALTLLSEDHPELLRQMPAILKGISGHSFRVGMVQDLITAGEPMAVICIEGGWETSSMPLMYGRNLEVRNGGCARLRDRLGGD